MRPVQIHSLSNEHNIPDASTHRNQWIQRFSAGEPLPVPLVRVYLCGALSIEVLCDLQTAPDGTLTPIYNSPEEAPAFSTGERHGVRKRPKSVSTARNLLKLLVSQPGRFAAKDWLIEQLRRPQREEEDEDLIGSGGLARFDNVVALLRGLLCPVGIGETESLRKRLVKLVTTTPRSGDGYRLAPYPLIWVDVDALTTHAQRACALEAEGHDALHEWQAAYTLGMRGPVLQEEVYSDWAQIWREEIEGYLWQSVQALWRHALSRGQ
ncbi:MAG: bacterial transcriptional activator domain-containing protein [Ktedonobacteraceae bacterium]|nr:bacterial transcriptional activator domain-containing protein [Ktedonobacteraceae bacterium]